jgi:hypothetical protein
MLYRFFPCLSPHKSAKYGEKINLPCHGKRCSFHVVFFRVVPTNIFFISLVLHASFPSFSSFCLTLYLFLGFAGIDWMIMKSLKVKKFSYLKTSAIKPHQNVNFKPDFDLYSFSISQNAKHESCRYFSWCFTAS